jgi:DNA-binding transcriptional LysR family regulator
LQELNLRYLYEAAKLGSMRAAADSLGVAVSSVSRQISQLEADVGIALIEHGRRNIQLTETGRLLIEHYSDQLRLNEAFEAKLSDIKGHRRRLHRRAAVEHAGPLQYQTSRPVHQPARLRIVK